jgi:selenide,water dikinase
VFAKGGRPRHALALVTIPDGAASRSEETLVQVLTGIRAGLDPLGVTLVGGHTTAGAELFVGLSISGVLEAGVQLLPLAGARPGDALVLTKGLGTGVVLAADMAGRAKAEWVEAAVASMIRANDVAARVASQLGAHACTDVSGFGLAGHLGGMLQASGVGARLFPDALPALPGAAELLEQGVHSTFHPRNQAATQHWVDAPDPPGLLFDPQTSGGLLFALSAERSEAALRSLREGGDPGAKEIGRVIELPKGGACIRLGAPGDPAPSPVS